MKKVLLFSAAMALVATSAFAVGGIDLSMVACPGNAGGLGLEAGPVDCASGNPIIFLGTFAPAEAIPDMAALDGQMAAQVGGPRAANGFWDFDGAGCNVAGLSSAQARPSSGCSSGNIYTATWSPAGSGSAIGGIGTGPTTESFGFTVFRPSGLSVTADQKLFGLQVLVDGSTAVEAGGACPGCGTSFCLVWNEGDPRSIGGSPVTPLVGPTGHFPGYANTVSVNGGQALCAAVPAKKHTWGQLKSLYR